MDLILCHGSALKAISQAFLFAVHVGSVTLLLQELNFGLGQTHLPQIGVEQHVHPDIRTWHAYYNIREIKEIIISIYNVMHV